MIITSNLFAGECNFQKMQTSFSVEGKIVNQELVDYPQLFNDSSDPLSYPIIKNYPEVCKDSPCSLQILEGDNKPIKISYMYNRKKKFGHSGKKSSLNLFNKKENFILFFKIIHKEKELCSHKIEISQRD